MMRLLFCAAVWVLAGVVSAQQYAPAARVYQEHNDLFRDMALSPDGKTVAIAGMKGVWLHDAQTFETVGLLEAPEVIKGDRNTIAWSTAFSPDGAFAAGGTTGGHVLIWEVKSGRLKHTLEAHEDTVYTTAFSPDSKTLATGGQDRMVRLWEVESGRLKHTLEGHPSWVQSAAFSPDGAALASGCLKDAVCLWDAETGRLIKMFKGDSGCDVNVAFSPDGKTLLSGCWNGGAHRWDVETLEPLETELEGGESGASSVAYSPDGTTIAGVVAGRKMRIWDAETGRQKWLLIAPTTAEIAHFSPDGKTLAVGGSLETMFWDLETGAEIVPLKGHTGAAASLTFSLDGKKVVSGSHDKTVRIWDADTGEMIRTLEGHTEGVHSAAFSPDSKTVLSGGHDKTVRIWNADTGEMIRALEGHTGAVLSVAFSPDGRTAASAGHDKTVRIWDIETGALLHTMGGHTDWTTAIAFSLEGNRLASAGLDKSVRIWNALTGEPIQTVRSGEVFTLRYTQKGNIFYSGEAVMHLIDGRDGSDLQRIETHMAGEDWYNHDALTGEVFPSEITAGEMYEKWFLAAALSPDGKTAATGARDSLVMLIDVGTRRFQTILGGLSSPIKSLAYSPDGTRLAGGAEDGAALIWKLPATTEEVE